MAVYCTKCGEELLGSVNRCWKCGQAFVSRPGSAVVPPQRRAPVRAAEAEPVEAVFVADPVAVDAPREEPEETEPGVRRWIRRGSPFAEPDQPPPQTEQPSEVELQARPTRYPRHSAAVTGSLLSILLGLVSGGVAFVLPWGALLLAGMGLAMGAWGLYSRRRGAAVVGLLICCLSFSLGAFFCAVDLYTLIHGVSPWEIYSPVVDPNLPMNP